MTATTTLKLNQQQLEVLLDAVEGQCTFALSSREVDEHDALLQRLEPCFEQLDREA